MATRTIVVGAGFAGLAAAVRLADAGREVVLVEATKTGGGRSRSFFDKVTGREIDNGQHLMMGCYHETLDFLRTIEAPRAAVDFQTNLSLTMQAQGGRRIELDCPTLPAPDIYLAAARLAATPVGDCLVLEDSNTGVRGGIAAGARVVMVPDMLSPAEDVLRLGVPVMKDLFEVAAALRKPAGDGQG